MILAILSVLQWYQRGKQDQPCGNLDKHDMAKTKWKVASKKSINDRSITNLKFWILYAISLQSRECGDCKEKWTC